MTIIEQLHNDLGWFVCSWNRTCKPPLVLVLVKLKHPTEMTPVWFINTEVISVICGIHHVDRERVEASTRHADWVPDLWGVRGRTGQPDKVSP